MPKMKLDAESLSVESYPTSDADLLDWVIPTTLKTNPTCCPCTP